MSMQLVFNTWPEGEEVREVWFTKLEAEGWITQATLEFSHEAAMEKARALNENVPAVATVLGPYRLVRTED